MLHEIIERIAEDGVILNFPEVLAGNKNQKPESDHSSCKAQIKRSKNTELLVIHLQRQIEHMLTTSLDVCRFFKKTAQQTPSKAEVPTLHKMRDNVTALCCFYS